MNRTARRVARRVRARFATLSFENLENRALLASVSYEIHLLPPDGSIAGPNLTTIGAGQSYDLAVSVRDLRTQPQPFPGVYAGYLDIEYDSAKTQVRVAEIQRIKIGALANPADNGTFSLAFNGETTAPISLTHNAAEMAGRIASAIANLPSVGPGHVTANVDVLSTNPTEMILQVRFGGKFFNQNVANMTVASQSLSGPGSPAVTISYEGDLQSGSSEYAFREAFRSLNNTSMFQNGVSAIDAPNLLDEVGAFAGLNPTGSERRELVRARMLATAEGTVTFSPSLANRILPLHDTLLLNAPGPVPLDEVELGPAKSLVIGQPPPPPIFAVADTASMLAPLYSIFIDVLANDTTTPPTGQIKELVSVGQPTLGQATIRNGQILYTPTLNTSGTDTFTYTARNKSAGATSETSTGTVTVTIGSGDAKLLRYDVRLVPVNGALFMPDPQNTQSLVSTGDLTTINVGEMYDLVVTAQAADPKALGVFAAYLDIGYDSEKTQVQTGETYNLRLEGEGSFALSYGGETTQSITRVNDVLDMARNIQKALEALSGVGPNDVQVFPAGTGNNEFVVRFSGRLVGQDLPDLTETPGNTVTVTIAPTGTLSPELQAKIFSASFLSAGVAPLTNVSEAPVFYPFGVHAGDKPNLLDDVGAFTDPNLASTPGQLTVAEIAKGYRVAPPREVVRARLKATAPGTVNFAADLASIEHPVYDTLLYGGSQSVAALQIDLGPAKALTIHPVVRIVANSDPVTILEDAAATEIDVLANDTTAPEEEEGKAVVAVTQGAHGTVTFTESGVTYKPAGNFFGTDTFTYSARNTSAGPNSPTSTATVTVTVQPVNDTPTLDAIGPPVAVLEDAQEITLALTGISAGGDEDQTLTGAALSDNPTLTSASLHYEGQGSGSLSFKPQANASGTANIVVSIQDNGGTAHGAVDIKVRTVTVTILPVNDAPTFVAGANQEVNDESGPQSVPGWATQIAAGPPNEADQTLQFLVSLDNPSLFSVLPTISPNGTLTYTPAPNASGEASVTVRLKDDGLREHGGVDESEAKTFTIRITKLNVLHNVALPLDTSGDGGITSVDVLNIIDFINAFGAGPVAPQASGEGAPQHSAFVDANGDGHVTAADALSVIDFINAFGAMNPPDSGPEGEAGNDGELLSLLAADAAASIGARRRR